MATFLLAVSAFAYLIWFVVLILPWQPWLHTETLEPNEVTSDGDLSDLTVLIPARNEADVIADTLRALAGQGKGLRIVLVDDGSDDGTAEIAQSVAGVDVQVVAGQALPSDWSGKLWALEQGSREVKTAWTLLLDADIQLKPGMVAALLEKARQDRRSLVSVMARLRMESCWEKLLMPAFIYFFKLLYPFRLANSDSPYIAAAAGGCILLETRVIGQIGGFTAIKDALIDDCTLARRVKQGGNRIWVGQSHSVVSIRQYEQLEPIWEMVARSAFTQLHYSGWLLALCTGLILTLFVGPIAAILWGDANALAASAVAVVCMAASYWPTLRYYQLRGAWAWLLPIIAVLYLAMTWTSALRYWRGDRSRWKNRIYSVKE